MAQLAWQSLKLNVSALRVISWAGCALVLLSGCGSTATTETASVQPPIRLALAPYQDALLPSLGESKGWYKEEGLNVEIKMMAMSEMQEALAAGAVDVAFNNISSVISTHAKDPNTVYAYGFNIFDEGYALMIRPQGAVKPLSDFLKGSINRDDAIKACVAQLKGKTVVTTSHTDMEQAVCTAVTRGGLDFVKDIHVRDFNPDEGLAAFLSGTGDAFLGGIPQRTRANKEGMIEMLSGTDLGSPEINGYVTTREFASNHQDQLLKLLHVWFRSVQYVDHNMDDGGSVIVAKLNSQSGASFTIDDFKRFWNKIEHYPPSPSAVRKDILEKTGKAYWLTRWNDCNNYFVDITKSIPKKVDPKGVFIMPEVQQKYVERYGSN
jgi:ABC-type nitrate/sulfonate/bicarbonate transport system substrate-binding protein